MATDLEIGKAYESFKDVARLVKSAVSVAQQAIAYNSANAIDWNNVATTNEAMVDAAGNVVDSGDAAASATPAEVSNAIGSLDNLLTTWWAAHGGNLQKLTDPIV